MITARRASERFHEHGRKRRVWLTFERPSVRPLVDAFGALTRFDEQRLPRSGGMPSRGYEDVEVLLYVREGSVAFEDGGGRSWMLQAGEFQLTTASRRARHKATNASRADGTHLFELCIRTTVVGLTAERTLRRFSAGERRGELCVVASEDGRRGSLRLHEDVAVYSALVSSGQHLIHPLAPGRSAWLHVVTGEVVVGDLRLTMGDAAGVVGERSISFTSREPSEILLVDLPAEAPPLPAPIRLSTRPSDSPPLVAQRNAS